MMNIRYAGTPLPKGLKHFTAERRQFRTNECDIGAYGAPLVGYSASCTSTNWRHSSGGKISYWDFSDSLGFLSTSDDRSVSRSACESRDPVETPGMPTARLA